MGYNPPDTREKALNAALESMRGSGLFDVETLLKAARVIEAYLNGTDQKPEQTGGPTGAIGTGGQQWPNYGIGQNQQSQGMPQ